MTLFIDNLRMGYLCQRSSRFNYPIPYIPSGPCQHPFQHILCLPWCDRPGVIAKCRRRQGACVHPQACWSANARVEAVYVGGMAALSCFTVAGSAWLRVHRSRAEPNIAAVNRKAAGDNSPERVTMPPL